MKSTLNSAFEQNNNILESGAIDHRVFDLAANNRYFVLALMPITLQIRKVLCKSLSTLSRNVLYLAQVEMSALVVDKGVAKPPREG